MGQNFNPNTPLLIGNEHGKGGFTYRNGDTYATHRGLRWRALASGVLNRVLVASHSQTYPSRQIIAEIVPTASEAMGAVTVDTFLPNAIANVVGITNQAGGAAVVGNITAQADTYFMSTVASGQRVDVEFATAAFPLDRHVLAVEVRIAASLRTLVERMDGALVGQSDSLASTGFYSLEWQSCSMPEVVRVGGAAPYLWWTPQMIRDFDNGTRRIRLNALDGSVGTPWYLDYMELRVYSIPERRLAVGVSESDFPPAVPFTWVPYDLQVPDRSGTWARVNGTDYTIILRKPQPNGPILPQGTPGYVPFQIPQTWRQLNGVAPFSNFVAVDLAAPADVINSIPFYRSQAGVVVDGVPSIRFQAPIGTDLAESQGYTSSYGLHVHDGATSPAHQTLVAPDVSARPIANVWLSTQFAPTQPITITVKNDATNAVVMGPVTITAAQAADLNLASTTATMGKDGPVVTTATFRKIRVEFPTQPALVAATKYRVELSSTTPASNPWGVLAFVANEAAADVSTYGGTNEKIVDGDFYYSTAAAEVAALGDVAVTLATRPAAPSTPAVRTRKRIVGLYDGNIFPNPSFENGIANAVAQANVAVSQSTDDRTPDGSHALRMTTVGAGNAVAQSAAVMAATAGQSYTASARFYANTVARTVQVMIRFVDAAGATLSDTYAVGQADNNVAAVTSTVTAVAPAGTTGMHVFFVVVASVAAEIHDVDAVAVGLTEAAGCVRTDCLLTSFAVPEVGWTYNAALLLAQWSAYEIQRSDAVTDWQTVARITDSTILRWIDHEARRGMPSAYRVRNVRTDGVGSDWALCGSVAVPAESNAMLLLTGNVRPDLSVATMDVGLGSKPGRDYAFAEADEVTLRSLYGRDYRVAFKPTERRGSAFNRMLLVDDGLPASPTLLVLRQIRDLAAAAVPYVCVLDGEGNRWFASISVPDGVLRRPRALAIASLRVVEITATAYTAGPTLL